MQQSNTSRIQPTEQALLFCFSPRFVFIPLRDISASVYKPTQNPLRSCITIDTTFILIGFVPKWRTLMKGNANIAFL